MASELRVNTLKDAAGNNSVAMTYVAEGSAKAWAGYNQTGTPAVDDSLNVASLTDTATGKTFVNFSSNMNNAGYSVSLAVSKWDSTDDGNSTCAIGSTTVVRTTAGHPSTHAEAAVKGNFDTANICSTVHGDLA